MDRLDPAQIGMIESCARPTAHAGELGCVGLKAVSHAPHGRFEAGSFATLVLTFTIGRLGVDDGGHLRIALRWTYDGGRLQAEDPAAPNFVTGQAAGAALEIAYDPEGHTRPFDKAVTATVRRGCLAPGDRVTLTLGATDGGSPGLRLQSFAEEAFALRCYLDPMATQHYTPLPEQLSIEIEPGAAAGYRLIGPTRRRVGEPFDLLLRAEDALGNPTPYGQARFRLAASAPLDGLPAELAFDGSKSALRIGPLKAREEGELCVRAIPADDTAPIEAPPLSIVPPGSSASYWADFHGQSGETVGINSAASYFAFARDIALLDAAGHQGNDFQITDAFWAGLNRVTGAFDAPGHFVAFPGYEWSGTTAVGGDRNVLFRHEGEAIRRSSRALVPTGGTGGPDVPTAAELFAALHGRDAVCFAHVGGRYAELALAHDAELETSVELHSCWGTFEWLLADALRLGHRVGVVCNSDDHKGRPGAAHPGTSTFGAYGGLTCLIADRLDRDALFEALRRRRTYGTTGVRLDIEVAARLPEPGALYERDPAIGTAATTKTVSAGLGDIVATAARSVALRVRIAAPAPIVGVEVRRGLETFAVERPYGEADLGDRLLLSWEGSALRGRGRQARWDGALRLNGARVDEVVPFGFWSPAHWIRAEGSDRVAWSSVTSGNRVGAQLALAVEQPGRAALAIETPQVSAELRLAEIGLAETVIPAGGHDLCLRLARLPDRLERCSLAFEIEVPLFADCDTPVYLAVMLADGHRAWTSPIYFLQAVAAAGTGGG